MCCFLFEFTLAGAQLFASIYIIARRIRLHICSMWAHMLYFQHRQSVYYSGFTFLLAHTRLVAEHHGLSSPCPGSQAQKELHKDQGSQVLKKKSARYSFLTRPAVQEGNKNGRKRKGDVAKGEEKKATPREKLKALTNYADAEQTEEDAGQESAEDPSSSAAGERRDKCKAMAFNKKFDSLPHSMKENFAKLKSRKEKTEYINQAMVKSKEGVWTLAIQNAHLHVALTKEQEHGTDREFDGMPWSVMLAQFHFDEGQLLKAGGICWGLQICFFLSVSIRI